jgi:hypothetical protein
MHMHVYMPCVLPARTAYGAVAAAAGAAAAARTRPSNNASRRAVAAILNMAAIPVVLLLLVAAMARAAPRTHRHRHTRAAAAWLGRGAYWSGLGHSHAVCAGRRRARRVPRRRHRRVGARADLRRGGYPCCHDSCPPHALKRGAGELHIDGAAAGVRVWSTVLCAVHRPRRRRPLRPPAALRPRQRSVAHTQREELT